MEFVSSKHLVVLLYLEVVCILVVLFLLGLNSSLIIQLLDLRILVIFSDAVLEVIHFDNVLKRLSRGCIIPISLELDHLRVLHAFNLLPLLHLDTKEALVL